MAGIVRIDDEVIDTVYFIRTLKLTGQFEGLVEQLVREYGVGDGRENGGVIGKVLRGSLPAHIEARVFNAAPGELLGPFPSQDRELYEIYMVNAKHPAALDEDTAVEVRRLLREEWLVARAQEHIIEACSTR